LTAPAMACDTVTVVGARWPLRIEGPLLPSHYDNRDGGHGPSATARSDQGRNGGASLSIAFSDPSRTQVGAVWAGHCSAHSS